MNKIHRDRSSGMVAEQFEKDGVFVKEIEQNTPDYMLKDTFKEFLLKQYSPAYFETLGKILS